MDSSKKLYTCAFRTYGWQKRPIPGQKNVEVKALKIGYSGPITNAILAVMGEHAKDITSKQASYHYIRFTDVAIKNIRLNNNWLLMQLTSDEWTTIELITRQTTSYSGIYLWDNTKNIWLEFPNKNTDWAEARYTTAPSINPYGNQSITPSQLNDTTNPAITVITKTPAQSTHQETQFADLDSRVRHRCVNHPIYANLSKKYPNQPGWWWITGDSKPHKDTLNYLGARWAPRKKQWYFTNENLSIEVVQMLQNRHDVALQLAQLGYISAEAAQRFAPTDDTESFEEQFTPYNIRFFNHDKRRSDYLVGEESKTYQLIYDMISLDLGGVNRILYNQDTENILHETYSVITHGHAIVKREFSKEGVVQWIISNTSEEQNAKLARYMHNLGGKREEGTISNTIQWTIYDDNAIAQMDEWLFHHKYGQFLPSEAARTDILVPPGYIALIDSNLNENKARPIEEQVAYQLLYNETENWAIWVLGYNKDQDTIRFWQVTNDQILLGKEDELHVELTLQRWKDAGWKSPFHRIPSFKPMPLKHALTEWQNNPKPSHHTTTLSSSTQNPFENDYEAFLRKESSTTHDRLHLRSTMRQIIQTASSNQLSLREVAEDAYLNNIQPMTDYKNVRQSGRTTYVGDITVPAVVASYLKYLNQHSKVPKLKPEPKPPTKDNKSLYRVGDTIYARDNISTPNANDIPAGTKGTIIQVLDNSHQVQQIEEMTKGLYLGISYIIDFGDVHGKPGWYFQDEITDIPPIPGLTVKRFRIGFTPDNNVTVTEPTSPSEYRDKLLENGFDPYTTTTDNKSDIPTDRQTEPCPCEKFIGPKGWYPAERLNTWMKCGCEPDEPIPTVSPRTLELTENSDPKKTFRKVTALAPKRDDNADDIDKAIIQLQQNKPSTSATTGTIKLAGKELKLPCNAVGEISATVNSDVLCYGYAIDEGICVYLNLGGPRSGVEAIRATLGQGGVANIIPYNDMALEITPSPDQVDDVRSGQYVAYLQHIPHARFYNTILLHNTIVEPDYDGYGHTYIIVPENVPDYEKLKTMEHIKAVVKIAVFPEWRDYIWEAGRAAKLIRTLRSDGGIQIWRISLNDNEWSRLISGGLYEKVIEIPKPAKG